MEAYLDHAATTPINDAAVEALVRVSRLIGNPSGSHRAARAAKDLLELSREQIGSYLGVNASEVIFTSGGTESDNLAIFGSLKDDKKPVASAIEHHAVLDAVTGSGGKLIGVTREGVVNLDELEEYLKLEGDTVCVISVMMANNETGVIQPLSEVLRLARKYSPGAACHTDAVQAPGYLDVADLASGFDLVSISAHKFGGPKGTGALVVKKSSGGLRAMLRGGGQEFELRPGTPNLAGIAAMAAALTDAVTNREENVSRIAGLTELLRQGLSTKFPGIRPTGIESSQMCNITNYCFEGLNSEEILFLLDSAGIFASAGSSCASGALNPSHVLLGMGRSKAEASGSLRLSLGVSTTKEEIDYAIDVIGDVTSELAAKKGILWV